MSKGNYFLGAFVGGILGAALGILLAPRSGVETREMIKDSIDNCCNETKSRVEHEWHDKTDNIKAKASNISNRVKELSEELEAKGREVMDKVSASTNKNKHPEAE